ncbi:MAG: VWA domain-containing protein, partial [Candidatus Latescibacteria bacterium]|nr:VWA domain-containing protein [Candidatus Latescibacterota bacterium]
MRDFDLTLSNGWLLALLIPVCIYLVFQVYNSRNVVWLLGVRIAAFLLVIVLLMAPILALKFQTTRKPLVAVLVDDSESMQIVDAGVTRQNVVRDLLNDSSFGNLAERVRVAYYRFADGLVPLDDPDALTWQGQATNLAEALDALGEEVVAQGLGAVVVISDGGQNQGGRPERAAIDLGVPVFTVGIGDPIPPKDVAMVSGVMDRLGYVGRRLSLSVRFRVSGYDGLQERVVVEEEGHEVASQIVQLRDGEQSLVFQIQPEHAGRHVYQVRIAPQTGERTVENNAVVVATEVLKSRVRLLVLAGNPSADLAYLRRLWSADENLEFQLVVNEGQRDWSGRVQRRLRDINQYDVVVLVNVAHDVLAGDGENRLVSFVKAGGGG